VHRASLVLLASLFAYGATFEESFRAGLVALQQGDLTNAATNLRAASALAPGNGRVWIALAQTYRKLHQDAQAEEAASQAAKFAPDDKVVQQSLAIYYSETGATLKAAAAQTKYAALSPADAFARERAETLYFEAAQPLLQREKFAEAIQILAPARAKLPGSAQLELALGVAYYGLRRFDEAAQAFLRTIQIAPGIEQPYLFLGRFLDQVPNRLPEATKRFAEFETLRPSSPIGYLQHARALDAQSQEPERAAELLNKAISLNDRDAAAHFELGTVLDRLQRFDNAAREFARAADLDPKDAAAHYRLARDYDRLGKPAEAQAERDKHAALVKSQDAAR
jgi:tetratricopeptide (TPR) repeat protein